MSLLAVFLDELTFGHEVRFVSVLLGSEVSSCLLKVLDFDASLLLSLLAFLHILLEVVFLDLELLSELLDALAGGLYLLLHADVVLHGGAQLGEPELLHVLKLLLEVRDLVVARLVRQVAELSVQLRLHVVTTEVMNQLQDVRLDCLGVSASSVALVLVLEKIRVAVERLHVHGVSDVDSLKVLLALSLRVEQASNLVSECSRYQ